MNTPKETSNSQTEYVLVYTLNGESKYYSKNASGKDTWLTDSLELAQRYTDKDTATKTIEVYKKVVSDVFGWKKVLIEAKPVRITLELQ